MHHTLALHTLPPAAAMRGSVAAEDIMMFSVASTGYRGLPLHLFSSQQESLLL